MNDTIPSHHIIVYLCRSPMWWLVISYPWGNQFGAQWRALYGRITRVSTFGA